MPKAKIKPKTQPQIIIPAMSQIPNYWDDTDIWDDDKLWQDFLGGTNMTCNMLPILTNLTNQTTIDDTILSPSLGVNVRLVDSTDPTKFFVGVVSGLTASIRNHDTGVYGAIVLSGVNSAGTQQNITVTLANIGDGQYGIYDEMYFTTNLDDTTNVESTLVTPANVIATDRDVQVFDTAVVAVGQKITYRLVNDARVYNGVITAIPAATATQEHRLTVATNHGTQNPTLSQITHPEFRGAIVVTDLDN